VDYPFYLYQSFKHAEAFLDSFPTFEFSSPENFQMVTPCFILIMFIVDDYRLALCKGRRVRAATLGTLVTVDECCLVDINVKAICKDAFGVDSVLLDPYVAIHCQDGRQLMIRNAILNNNKHVDSSYFSFPPKEMPAEIIRQANDAIHTALRLYGLPENIPNLMEPQILDFDWRNLFPASERIQETLDGRVFYEHAGRILYLHKVHATPVERALGVDLVYNYVEERRLVLIQYKCHKGDDDKWYDSSDSNHGAELRKMLELPGIASCPNLSVGSVDLRICRCPAFFKLCERKIRQGASIPDASYYPVCIWKRLVDLSGGRISRTMPPHMNNEQFQGLVRGGLIGSVPSHSLEIEDRLLQRTGDNRFRLFFHELRGEPDPMRKPKGKGKGSAASRRASSE
jgi:hypothetical protein